MNRINVLLTLSSLNVLLVTIERYSFTTKILLQPYNYLRLHEVVQMSLIILFTVVIPAFLIKEVSHNFESFRTKKGQLIALLFLVGVYFYATGNGLHEVASFLFNQYCDVKKFTSPVCGSMFFNDYYTGNTIYFIGAYMMNLAIILFELLKPGNKFSRKEMNILIANSLLYALAVFAYAAFDRVLVGFVFTAISMVTVDLLLLRSGKKFAEVPVTTYMAITYTLGTIASLLVRFL